MLVAPPRVPVSLTNIVVSVALFVESGRCELLVLNVVVVELLVSNVVVVELLVLNVVVVDLLSQGRM